MTKRKPKSKRGMVKDIRCDPCIHLKTECLFGEGDHCPYRQSEEFYDWCLSTCKGIYRIRARTAIEAVQVLWREHGRQAHSIALVPTTHTADKLEEK